MDFFANFIAGFTVALQPLNITFCFLGVFTGTLIGVLPGIGPVGTMAILLPVTYGIPPTTAIIMLAGIYYGAQYGGSTTSILVNIPGEAASVITCLDGYQMARKGRAGPALGIAAFGSFIAGTLGVIGLQLLAPPLVSVALKFGPPEYFSLMLLGFVILTYLAQKSMVKALLTAGVGVVLGTIGLDTMTGMPRFTFNIPELLDGVGLAPLAMGLFGISEILLNVEKKMKQELLTTRVKGLLPNLEDWRRSIWAILRGTGSGFFLGILPGGGAVLGSFVSYALEKRVSKNPEEFGKGAIEGVAAPEAANNAASQGAFIPLLTLGIPANVVMAILLGALMIHNITPGPMLVKEHPQLFWGVISSMYLGNVMLIILNLPLIGLWVQLLRIPYSLLFPLILFICLIGAYVINNSTVDVLMMFVFGVVGYFMRKFEYEPAPMVLAYVLTPLLENALRQSLILSDGSFGIFMRRPISAGCLIIAAFLLLSSLLPMLRKKRETLVAEAEKDE
ncbi:MAG: tripartite tricarboxylate transporter permease [Syntrophaceae bacterium]|jgi:putative tricarboxylic transport membrane protein|nr:tripartite tricarboxylate transporter permease [Syntrophaceae bacterium]